MSFIKIVSLSLFFCVIFYCNSMDKKTHIELNLIALDCIKKDRCLLKKDIASMPKQYQKIVLQAYTRFLLVLRQRFFIGWNDDGVAEVGIIKRSNIADVGQKAHCVTLFNKNYSSLSDIPGICFELMQWWTPEISRLYLNNNELERIPDRLTMLKNLVYLNVRGNNLHRLPAIDALRKLEVIDLSDNSFDCIPYQIFYMSQLKKLLLQENKIEGIPRCIENLVNLESLDMSENLLKRLPDLKKLKKLKVLKLDGNKLGKDEKQKLKKSLPKTKLRMSFDGKELL